jgi:hypothetical protein
LENRRVKQVLWRGFAISGMWEGKYSAKYCVYICVNGKMRPAETISGKGWGMKENDGRGEFKYDLFDIL